MILVGRPISASQETTVDDGLVVSVPFSDTEIVGPLLGFNRDKTNCSRVITCVILFMHIARTPGFMHKQGSLSYHHQNVCSVLFEGKDLRKYNLHTTL